MSHLYLFRHGETDWNESGRFQGHTNVPLSARGRQQVQALAERAARLPLRAIYTSDLARAQESARLLAARHPGDPPVVLEPRLREIDVGQVAGLTWAEILARFPQVRSTPDDPSRPRFPGGESIAQLEGRTLAAISDIAARYAGQSVGVVTHGGVIKSLVRVILKIPATARDALAFDNCGITWIQWESDRRRIRSLNDIAHLSGEM